MFDLDRLEDRDVYLVRDAANAMAANAAVGPGQRAVWARLGRSLSTALLDRAQVRADELALLRAHGMPGWHEAVERVQDLALEDPLTDDAPGSAS